MNSDAADLAPQLPPPSADDNGVDLEKEGDYVGSGDEGQEGGPANGLKTTRRVCVGRRFPAQGGAAGRRDQHAVFFLDSGGMAVGGEEKPRATTPDPIPCARRGGRLGRLVLGGSSGDSC
ncbi:hypothetical protein GUJ93_ZPchr0006g44488 [Zizania palustris]|uniref:Uncharacterized protein n=1 Tax=Zizania palustris TaxID=103762 RepID=A0A8J5VLA7_ZIZPA|nr:hypothetical protein GUJ93_ZPchr0006g44488 [Zizania palustris]